MPEKFASRHIVSDQVKVRRCLEGEFQANDERRICHSSPDKDVAFSQSVCHFLLLNNDLLGQNLHGVDALGVTLAHLKNLTERTLTNELQNFEVFGAIRSLLDPVEVKLEVDLASHLGTLALARLQGKPTIIWLVILNQVGAESDVTKKGLAIGSVVDGDVDLGVITNNVT